MATSSPLAVTAGSTRTDQIVTATRTLFLRYGYRRTTVDDIAREAGVAKATLYLHFAGKEDIFRAMLLRFRDVVNAACEVAEGLDAPVGVRLTELLYAYYGNALEWFGDAAHLNELKTFMSEHPIGPFDDAMPDFGHRLQHALTKAVEHGEIAAPAEPCGIEDVAQTLMFAAHGAKRAQKSGAVGMRETLATIVTVIVGRNRD